MMMELQGVITLRSEKQFIRERERERVNFHIKIRYLHTYIHIYRQDWQGGNKKARKIETSTKIERMREIKR